ncbi:ROK family protein [Chitinibacteraceae bacterium HSL-7]
MNLIAIDIGGTQLKLGVVNEEGRVLVHKAVATPKAAAVMLQTVIREVEPWLAEYDVGGAAVSTLGLVDAATGTILGAAEAIDGYVGVVVKDAIHAALGVPVTVENDVNCVALAEGWQGSARGEQDFLAVAIGTGIGGGIVCDGRLYRGARGAGGEWGYMRVNGVVWEDYASMRGLVASVGALTGRTDLDGRAIFAGYDAGDPVLVSAVKDWYGLLATGVANLIYALNPACVVLGGGISGRGQRFLDEFNEALDAVLSPEFRAMTSIRLASAGNHAGLIGAARNWFQSLPQTAVCV